ncbi:histone-lysine N-methyltransferase ATXR4-like [Tasmannia lanceolata]|uniref:histone-lysine N-methyltransferase ATXR4-like n=1 Tax=Tasmannia lanceolata TaxID=3420 RepID=UPI004062EAAE
MSWSISFSRWSSLKKLQNPTRNNPLLLLLLFSSSSTSTALPPPIRVSLTESAGRGTFATRKIGTGELIHTAKPLLTHPSLSLLHQVCYLCLKRLGMKASEACLSSPHVDPTSHFCSEECRDNSKAFFEVERKADWSAYDDHCKMRGLKYPFLVMRLACMVISGSASLDCLDILQPASLSFEMISEMEKEFELLRHTLMKAGIKNKHIAFLTKEWYISVLARIRINAFRIELVGGSYEDLLSSAAASVAAEAAVGNAVYMLPSFYNHDCDPNAHIVWIDNADARLKALRDIEEGEELCICYIDASMDHDARQTLLNEGFGFQCRCLRCMSGD